MSETAGQEKVKVSLLVPASWVAFLAREYPFIGLGPALRTVAAEGIARLAGAERLPPEVVAERLAHLLSATATTSGEGGGSGGGKGDGFDEPLAAGEASESEAAWRAYLHGEDPGEPLATVRRELLGRRG